MAAPIGPVYPMPGGPGAGHGGSTCKALSDSEAAAGKTAAQNGTATDGQTWHYGAGTDPAQGEGCDFSATPMDLAPFDTTRFERLFWGVTSTPTLSLDADGDTTDPGEVMTLDGTVSDPSAGRLVWTGSTTMTWCQPASCSYATSPVPTRFVLNATSFDGDPVVLVDPASLGLPTTPGGLVEVTSQLTNFKVTVVMLADDPSTAAEDFKPAISMYNSFNHPPPSEGSPAQTQMSFGGGFYYLSRPPTGSITGPASPEAGQQATYTASATDPDGSPGDAPLTYAWDTDGDSEFDDGTTRSVQVTYAAGDHDLAVRVTDADGATATLTRTVTAADTTPPAASVTLNAMKLAGLIKNGLKGSVSTSEPSTANIRANLPKKLANRLGLKNPIAKGTVAAPSGGSVGFTLALSRTVRNKLKNLTQVSITVKAVVRDTAGNVSTAKKTRTYK